MDEGAPAEVADSNTVYCPIGVVLVVATVTVTVTGLFTVGETVADGAKLQVTPKAGALQESVTEPLNGPEAPTTVVICELVDGNVLMLLGEGAPRVKSTTFNVTV